MIGAFDSFGDYLLTLQMINIVAMLGCFWQARKEEEPGKWLLTALLCWLIWLVLLVVHLVYMIVIHDWLGIVIDVALLIWVWWEFFGGSGKWKKWKKRAKEKVAVIKGRLKVVPVPAPSPA